MKNSLPLYRLFRFLLSGIYKLWYNPKIIGAENIPDTGNVVIASNHIHVFDQCNIIIKTKRCIRYMAKKEYFKGRLAWFFKGVGCISVNRDHKDSAAVNKAIEVLKEGHCLGIFPEGTRNRIKKDQIEEIYLKYFKDINYTFFYKKIKNNKLSQINYLIELFDKEIITKKELKENIFLVDKFLKDLAVKNKISKADYYNSLLLPFKFGAVSIASKTTSKIVPVAVSGDYKFRSNNLIIKIGKPMAVVEDLEKANVKLRKETINLLKNL